MSTKQLEQRVARLETEFEQMKADFRCATGQGWRAVVGSHEGSKTFEGVVREVRRLRREEYADAARKDVDLVWEGNYSRPTHIPNGRSSS